MADDMDTINRKVTEGLNIAREHAADEPDLIELINLMETQWAQQVVEFMKLARSYHGFQWRSKEETLRKLRIIQAIVQKGPQPNTLQVGNA